MKIFLIADEESKYIWDHYDEALFEDVDIIISAGDLKSKYLEFLTTVARKPLLYVAGNHDNRYEQTPPYGCENIDDAIYVHNGIRILGLGGSYRYKPGPYQYTEKEMKKRIKKLKVLINQFGGFDILVTHAPALGVGDGDDLCHRGFQSFTDIVDKYKPSYFLHGHQHLTYRRDSQRINIINKTIVINGYNYHKFEYKQNLESVPKLQGLKKILNTIRFYYQYFQTSQMKQYQRFKRLNKE